MSKNNSLKGFLLITGILALSMLALAPNPQALSSTDNVVVSNFRLAHTWNGFFIPSMDVTGAMTDPVVINIPVFPGMAYRLVPVTGNPPPPPSGQDRRYYWMSETKDPPIPVTGSLPPANKSGNDYRYYWMSETKDLLIPVTGSLSPANKSSNDRRYYWMSETKDLLIPVTGSLSPANKSSNDRRYYWMSEMKDLPTP